MQAFHGTTKLLDMQPSFSPQKLAYSDLESYKNFFQNLNQCPSTRLLIASSHTRLNCSLLCRLQIAIHNSELTKLDDVNQARICLNWQCHV